MTTYFDPNNPAQTAGAETPPEDITFTQGDAMNPVNFSVPLADYNANEFVYDSLGNLFSVRNIEGSKLIGSIDASQIDIVNIPAENISGTAADLELIAGSINIATQEFNAANYLTLTSRIDSTLLNTTGNGYQLSYLTDGEPVFAVGNFDQTLPEWVSGGFYEQGDVVIYMGNAYVSLLEHTGQLDNPSIDTTNWLQIQNYGNSFIFYSPDTGVIIGGTLTAGAIRGGNLESSGIPSPTEQGAFLDLDGGDLVFGNSNNYLVYNQVDGLAIKGDFTAGDIVIQNDPITGIPEVTSGAGIVVEDADDVITIGATSAQFLMNRDGIVMNTDRTIGDFTEGLAFSGTPYFADNLELPVIAAGTNNNLAASTSYVQTELDALRARLDALENP